MLLSLYLFLVIALPLALGAVVLVHGIPTTSLCPACAGETLRLRSHHHALLSRVFRGDELHLRWCPSCDWSGTVRLPRPVPARVLDQSAPPPTSRCAAGVEVRRLDLDGGAWQIRLECWAENSAWRGRLLFVGPGGRSWSDGRSLLTGDSALQVLSQVLALPDDTLAGRIRQVTR